MAEVVQTTVLDTGQQVILSRHVDVQPLPSLPKPHEHLLHDVLPNGQLFDIPFGKETQSRIIAFEQALEGLLVRFDGDPPQKCINRFLSIWFHIIVQRLSNNEFPCAAKKRNIHQFQSQLGQKTIFARKN